MPSSKPKPSVLKQNKQHEPNSDTEDDAKQQNGATDAENDVNENGEEDSSPQETTEENGQTDEAKHDQKEQKEQKDQKEKDPKDPKEKKEKKEKKSNSKPKGKSARQIASRMKKLQKNSKKATNGTTTKKTSPNPIEKNEDDDEPAEESEDKETKKDTTRNQSDEDDADAEADADAEDAETEAEEKKKPASKNSKSQSKDQPKDKSKDKSKDSSKDKSKDKSKDNKSKDNKSKDKSKTSPKASQTSLSKKEKELTREERFKQDTGLNSYRISTGVLESRPASRDVKIGAFSLQSYGRELIKDTTIELTIGRRYGLIGSNGCGKSSFLKCLAHREVPIPEHIDIFLLEEEVEPSERTALQSITDSIDQEIERLEKEAETLMEVEGPDSDVVQDIYNRIEELDPETCETRASKLLHGLGFDKKMQSKMTKDMSGGWRMRVALAKALFVKPTLLLLDEPTNHLDLEACVWLEGYLKKYDRCLVVISHSQDFLNGVCTNIIHITPKKQLQYYTGNYDQFVRTKKELEINQMKRFKKEQDDIKHIKQFIASCGTYANLVRQAKSKQKIIDKMEAAGLTEAVEAEQTYKFTFPPCGKLSPPVLAFYNVGFSYSGDMKDALYRNLNLGVDLDSRIALVGKNGAGKSTLLKLMIDELEPTEGMIRKHTDLRIARYHQHSADLLVPNKTPLQFIRDTFGKLLNKDEEEWRALLGKYGVSGQQQLSPMRTMSDGQKSRIVFAYLATKNPHLLLLDEPTNHLDMDCIDALAKAINTFEGGMVLVSHDFRLIKQVAKEIWVCGNKTVTKWKGDIISYKQSLIKEMAKN